MADRRGCFIEPVNFAEQNGVRKVVQSGRRTSVDGSALTIHALGKAPLSKLPFFNSWVPGLVDPVRSIFLTLGLALLLMITSPFWVPGL